MSIKGSVSLRYNESCVLNKFSPRALNSEQTGKFLIFVRDWSGFKDIRFCEKVRIYTHKTEIIGMKEKC